MAATYTHFVAGASLVSVCVPSAPSVLIPLGYTIAGSKITFTAYEKPIFSDQFGGPNGTPADVLLHGMTADIDLQLVDFTLANIKKAIAHKTVNEAYGTPEPPGTLLLAGSRFIRVLLNSPGDPHNFPFAHITGNPDFVHGTDNTVYGLKFRALRNTPTGALFNATTT